MTFLMTFLLFTTLGLILMKLGRFLFSEYGQTNGHSEKRTDRQTRFRNSHMETCRNTIFLNSKLKIKSYLSIAICIPG